MAIHSHLSDDGTTLTISVEGRFDYQLHKAFREAYQVGEPRLAYVVDLGGVEHLDSSALGLMLLLREHAGGDAARVTLRGAPRGIRKILELSQFERLFRME